MSHIDSQWVEPGVLDAVTADSEDADPKYDVTHPSGNVLFRSARGGYLHSVVLNDEAMQADSRRLAEAIVLAADVSFFKSLMQVRQEIVDAGHTPSAEVPTRHDMDAAVEALCRHELGTR